MSTTTVCAPAPARRAPSPAQRLFRSRVIAAGWSPDDADRALGLAGNDYEFVRRFRESYLAGGWSPDDIESLLALVS
jgi:hypothetical protein